MRFKFYWVLLLLIGGCDFELAPCGWPGCPAGERCVDNACVACGKAGEACCYQVNGGEYCTETNTGCDPGDGNGICSKSCGGPLMACCDGTACDNGSTCNTDGICEVIAGDACFVPGGTAHTFTIVQADCGYRTATFYTNTIADAEACRDAWDAAAPGEELCRTDVVPDSSHVCKDGESFGWELFYCSPAQLTVCEANFCGNPNGCTWATCPE